MEFGLLDFVLITLGIYVIVPMIFGFIKFSLACSLKPIQEIKHEYNPDGKAWAMVTGCTSGIGEEFAIQLSRDY